MNISFIIQKRIQKERHDIFTLYHLNSIKTCKKLPPLFNMLDFPQDEFQILYYLCCPYNHYEQFDELLGNTFFDDHYSFFVKDKHVDNFLFLFEEYKELFLSLSSRMRQNIVIHSEGYRSFKMFMDINFTIMSEELLRGKIYMLDLPAFKCMIENDYVGNYYRTCAKCMIDFRDVFEKDDRNLIPELLHLLLEKNKTLYNDQEFLTSMIITASIGLKQYINPFYVGMSEQTKTHVFLFSCQMNKLLLVKELYKKEKENKELLTQGLRKAREFSNDKIVKFLIEKGVSS